MEDAYMKTWEEATGYFQVDEERGLSSSQVESNRKKYGANEPPLRRVKLSWS